MPGIQEGNIVQVTWKGLCFGQQIQMSMTYVCEVSSTAPDVPTSLTNIIDFVKPGGTQDLTTPYLALLPPQYTLSQLSAQVIYPIRSVAVALGGGASPGTNANPCTAANDSAAITFRTALAGRKQVATKKIGPIGDGARTAGNLTLIYTALLAGYAVLLLDNVSGVGDAAEYAPVIYHRTTPGQYDDIISFVIGSTARVHRRRTVGVGK